MQTFKADTGMVMTKHQFLAMINFLERQQVYVMAELVPEGESVTDYSVMALGRTQSDACANAQFISGWCYALDLVAEQAAREGRRTP